MYCCVFVMLLLLDVHYVEVCCFNLQLQLLVLYICVFIAIAMGGVRVPDHGVDRLPVRPCADKREVFPG